MGSKVTVNKRTVVHAKSGGKAIASAPDFCKTPSPGGPVPIPYPNIAQSTDTAQGSKTVTMDGESIMLKDSEFSTSTGDEAGTAGGGVASSKTKGKAKFTVYSFDVKVEGKNVPRLGDAMSNNGNCPNTAAAALVQGNITTQDIQALAKACEEKVENNPASQGKSCMERGRLKHECCGKAIADEEKDPPKLYWEGAFHKNGAERGTMVERRNPRGGLPAIVPRQQRAILRQARGFARSRQLDQRRTIASMMGGLKFPDIVVPIDPTKPVGPGNIRDVYDLKFPCPSTKKPEWGEKGKQGRSYDRLLKPTSFPKMISPTHIV